MSDDAYRHMRSVVRIATKRMDKRHEMMELGFSEADIREEMARTFPEPEETE